MKVRFFALTKSQYDAIASKDETALYFVTDKKIIMKGSVRYSHPVEFVTEFPQTDIETGIFYVNTTLKSAKIYNGTTWISVGPTIKSEILDGGTDDEVPSTKAVADYVSAITQGQSEALVSSYISGKNLISKKVDGSSNTYPIVGFVDSVTYDGQTHVMTFNIAGGTPVQINLPADNFLSSASYNQTSHILTMTMVDSSTVTVNLEDLIDTYTAKAVANNDTVSINIDASNVISAALRISANTGNRVEIKSDGIYVSRENVGAVNANNILISDSSGNVSASTVKIGGATFKSTPDSVTVPTEIGVSAFVASQISGIANVVEWQTL